MYIGNVIRYNYVNINNRRWTPTLFEHTRGKRLKRDLPIALL